MFLQEDLQLKEGSTLLALEHVRNCGVSFQCLLGCQSCLALLAFKHVLSFSVHFKGPSVAALEATVFAFLLM